MPGAIMLASIFFVTIIEMVFSPAQHVCGGNEGVAAVSRPLQQQEPVDEKHVGQELARTASTSIRRTYSEGSMQVREIGPLRGRTSSVGRTLTRYREAAGRLDPIDSAESDAGIDSKQDHGESAIADDAESNQRTHILTPEQVHKKAVMQCFLLEMGILFHSIFIGMSLAVAVGNAFIVLLIAIVFHQTFEGLALGVRIADIKWKERALQPWLSKHTSDEFYI